MGKTKQNKTTITKKNQKKGGGDYKTDPTYNLK